MSTCAPGHSHDYSAENARHFDDAARTSAGDRPEAVELARRLCRAFKRAYPFDEESTTVLDYACGTGFISRELAPVAAKIVGVDISQGAVDQYNQRVANQGIAPEEMQAVCTALKGVEGELEGAKFDVVVCASSYHHFVSIADVTRTLAYFLKPGGVLLVTDLIRGEHVEGLFPHVDHIVAHKGGFEETDIKAAFDAAGLQEFRFEKAASAKRHGHDVDFFLAIGRKANDT
ncbi:hypothetical protein PLICRDRAFT_53825 [Plicaturopsis crispa FD-325 SS-3]|nr:hypothetical protein PLICRDRAFT_53825 [Plicaturopsis crispa FD-325 SS-3]